MTPRNRDMLIQPLHNLVVLCHTGGERRIARTLLTCIWKLDHWKACQLKDMLETLDRDIDLVDDDAPVDPLPF